MILVYAAKRLYCSVGCDFAGSNTSRESISQVGVRNFLLAYRKIGVPKF